MRSTFVFRVLRVGEEPHNPGRLELAIIEKKILGDIFCDVSIILVHR